MASINYATRQISVKIVYYGPGLSGKTTNLQVIHKKTPQEHKSDMVSLATETDRTLFFDFLPLDLGKIKGFATKFQLYTVPGQVYYNATRKLVLRGVDGVVFVADSGADKVQENLESFQNLEDNLAEYGYQRESVPIILQYNKRDLPNALPIDELNRLINKYNLPWGEGIAYKGVGVFDTLKQIGKIVIDYLNKKYSRSSPGSRGGEAPAPARAPAPAPGYPPPQQAFAPPQQQWGAPPQQQYQPQQGFQPQKPGTGAFPAYQPPAQQQWGAPQQQYQPQPGFQQPGAGAFPPYQPPQQQPAFAPPPAPAYDSFEMAPPPPPPKAPAPAYDSFEMAPMTPPPAPPPQQQWGAPPPQQQYPPQSGTAAFPAYQPPPPPPSNQMNYDDMFLVGPAAAPPPPPPPPPPQGQGGNQGGYEESPFSTEMAPTPTPSLARQPSAGAKSGGAGATKTAAPPQKPIPAIPTIPTGQKPFAPPPAAQRGPAGAPAPAVSAGFQQPAADFDLEIEKYQQAIEEPQAFAPSSGGGGGYPPIDFTQQAPAAQPRQMMPPPAPSFQAESSYAPGAGGYDGYDAMPNNSAIFEFEAELSASLSKNKSGGGSDEYPSDSAVFFSAVDKNASPKKTGKMPVINPAKQKPPQQQKGLMSKLFNKDQ
jgi:signal recognition particle receptor subunit beta